MGTSLPAMWNPPLTPQVAAGWGAKCATCLIHNPYNPQHPAHPLPPPPPRCEVKELRRGGGALLRILAGVGTGDEYIAPSRAIFGFLFFSCALFPLSHPCPLVSPMHSLGLSHSLHTLLESTLTPLPSVPKVTGSSAALLEGSNAGKAPKQGTGPMQDPPPSTQPRAGGSNKEEARGPWGTPITLHRSAPPGPESSCSGQSKDQEGEITRPLSLAAEEGTAGLSAGATQGGFACIMHILCTPRH